MKFKFENGVLGKNFVICKICGAKRENIVTHIKRVHKISSEEYRKIYNSSVISDNCSKKLGDSVAKTIKRLWEIGKYNPICYGHEPNKSELKLQKISTKLVFTGGNIKGYGRLWLRTGKRLRNPDFIVTDNEKYRNKKWYEIQDQVSKDFINGYLKINKVVELNGLYWHSFRFNGKTKEEYEKSIIDDYAQIGIKCKVIWDDELRKNIETVKNKIMSFVEDGKDI